MWTVLIVLLSSGNQIVGWFLKLGHDHLPARLCQICPIIHSQSLTTSLIQLRTYKYVYNTHLLLTGQGGTKLKSN